jgi:hypothetical protein
MGLGLSNCIVGVDMNSRGGLPSGSSIDCQLPLRSLKSWADLGLAAAEKYDAIDVWSGASAGTGLKCSVSRQTEHHALALLILTPAV